MTNDSLSGKSREAFERWYKERYNALEAPIGMPIHTAWQSAIAWHQADLVERLEAEKYEKAKGDNIQMAINEALDKAIAIVRGGE